MSAWAIQIEGLGKRYRLGSRDRYQALRDVLARALRVPFHRVASATMSDLWALKDLSLEVKPGEALGIIGPNGSGKSTLLKVLSRITEPTEGSARIRGRIGSLLEVGTGFHPELTGRENIYLNGIILGMTKAEIACQFDAIVAFAEVDRFIDTPVKRYSSGMYVRLAFAVAAHLDVDILAVDEVLAVGDAAFQKKCLGKMEDIRSRQGRTILFVSHNLGAINLLTSTCLVLNQGTSVDYGQTAEVVNRYLQGFVSSKGGGYVDLSAPEWRRATQKPLERRIVYQSLRLVNERGETTNLFLEREPVRLELTFRSDMPSASLEFIVAVVSLDGAVIFSIFSGQQFCAIGEGRYHVSCVMDPNILRPGYYRLRLYLRSGRWQDIIVEAATVQIAPNPVGHHEMNYASSHPGLMGAVRVECAWSDLRPL